MLDAGEPGQRRPSAAAGPSPWLPLVPGQHSVTVDVTHAVLGLHGGKVEITLKTVRHALHTVTVVMLASSVLVG